MVKEFLKQINQVLHQIIKITAKPIPCQFTMSYGSSMLSPTSVKRIRRDYKKLTGLWSTIKLKTRKKTTQFCYELSKEPVVERLFLMAHQKKDMVLNLVMFKSLMQLIK